MHFPGTKYICNENLPREEEIISAGGRFSVLFDLLVQEDKNCFLKFCFHKFVDWVL